MFPINKGIVIKKYVSAYYNFVMEDGHSMVVNSIPCLGLGHGFQDEVSKHSYFGTNLVIDDLSRISGWSHGNVVVKNKSFKRDPITHKVIGMVF